MSLQPVKNAIRNAYLPIAQFMEDDEDFFDRVDAARLEFTDVARASVEDKKLAKQYDADAIAILLKTIGDCCEAIGKHIINDFTMGFTVNPEGYREGQKPDGCAGGLGFTVKGEDKYIERAFTMKGMSSLIPGYKMAEIIPKLGNTFTSFFPSAKLTDRWEALPPDPDNLWAKRKAVGSLKGETTWDMADIVIKTKKDASDIRKSSGGVKHIECSDAFLKTWGKNVLFDMSLNSKVFLGSGNRDIEDGKAEGAIEGNAELVFTVGLRVRIQFPREAAMWMTSCEDPADFSLLTFLRHLDNPERRAFGKNKRFAKVNRSSSPASTQRSLQAFAQNVGTVPARMSSDGFTLLQSGNVIYTNMTPDVDAFRAAEDAAYNAEEGEFTPSAVVGENAVNFKNKLLLLDWQGNIVSYLNDAGNVDLIGLQGSQALQDADVGDHLVRPCGSNKEFETRMENLCKRENIPYCSPEFYIDSWGRVHDYVDKNGKAFAYDPLDLHNEDAETSSLNAESQQALLRRGKMFKTIYENFDTYAMALSSRMEDRYYVTLYGYYATPQVLRRYTQAYSEMATKYTGEVDPEIDISASNLTGVKTFYPHQRRILGDALVRKPDNLILGVDAGGGKSLTYTSLALRYVRDNEVKRPLVVMPGGLKKQYVEEIYRFSNHQIRVFPLYKDTWDRLNAAGVSLPQLQKIIESQPPNTLFLMDYGFLKLRPKSIIVGTKRINTFTFAVWASRVFDMVIADECHKIKNVNSQTSVAFRTFSAYTKVRGLASGTVISNDANDLLGQVNVFSPNALGNTIDQFSKSKGIIDPLKLPALKRRLHRQCKEYNANKREWSFLLPKISYHDARIPMNPVLQEFHDKALKNILLTVEKEIEKDKTLNPGDPSDKMDAKITQIMKMALTPLEIFINAPDAPNNVYADSFKDLPDVKRNPKLYLKSPKVDVLDDLLDAQFAKTDAKVLVMSYNKAISSHVMRWSRHKAKMLHYTAEGAKQSDLVDEFRTNPNMKVMVADENTLKEGFNLQFCFPGDTRVLLPDGKTVTFEQLENDNDITHVMSYDLENKRIEPRKIEKIWKTPVDATDTYVRVNVKDLHTGRTSSRVVTDGHPFLLNDGREISAKNLKRGDKLITYGGNLTHMISTDEGYISEEEHIRKQKSEGAREQWENPIHIRKMRRIGKAMMRKHQTAVSAGHKAWINNGGSEVVSRNMRCNWKNPELRKQYRIGHMEWLKSAEFQEYVAERFAKNGEGYKQIVAALETRWSNPNSREQQAESMRERWTKPAYRARIRKEIRAAVTDEMRKLQSDRSKALWASGRFDNIDMALSPETRLRLNEDHKLRWANPAWRKKTIKALTTSANTPEGKAYRSEKMKKLWEQNPEKMQSTVAAMLKGQGIFPNRPERQVIDLGVDNLVYTGDGDYWLTLNMDGSEVKKNPDFIFVPPNKKRATKVVEVIGAREYTNRTGDYDKRLRAAYKEKGVDCLILDADYVMSNPARAKARIESHVNNHYLEVTMVAKHTNDKKVVGEFKYDLQVEGTHNYFVMTDSAVQKNRVPVLVHNCSMLVRLQTVWTVGEFNQALARVERPDKVDPENGSLQYNRPSIDFYWLMLDKSIDIAKTARLYSKIIERSKIEEYKLNPNFDAWFEGKTVRGVNYSEVPRMAADCSSLVTMSPEFIRDNNTFEALATRHKYYKTYMTWLDNEFVAAKEDLRAAIAKELGVEPSTIDDNKLRLLSMKKVLHTELEGSQKAEILRGFTPFVPGVAPYDPYNLGLVAASRFADTEVVSTDDDEDESIDEDVDDDEDEDVDVDEAKLKMEEVIRIDTGDIVVTEFGIGECERKTRTSSVVYVEIPSKRGGKVSVGVPLTSVFVPETAANRKRLEAIYQGMLRKKLPTATLMVDGDTVNVNDVYVPEEQVTSKQAIAPKKPIISAACGGGGKQGRYDDDDQGLIPQAAEAKPPTTPGTGLSPRANRPAGPTPPKVVSTKPTTVKPPGRPIATPGFTRAGDKQVKVPTPPSAPPKPKTPRLPNVELHLAHINSQLAIMAEADENVMFTEHGFHQIGKSLISEIATWRGLDHMIDVLEQYCTVNQDCMDLLEAQLKMWQRNERNLEKVKTNIGKERAFLRATTRMQRNPHEIFPYLIELEGAVFLMVDAQHSRDAHKLYNKRPAKGGATAFAKSNSFYLRFCANRQDMRKILEVIGDHITVTNLKVFGKEFDAIYNQGR